MWLFAYMFLHTGISRIRVKLYFSNTHIHTYIYIYAHTHGLHGRSRASPWGVGSPCGVVHRLLGVEEIVVQTSFP